MDGLGAIEPVPLIEPTARAGARLLLHVARPPFRNAPRAPRGSGETGAAKFGTWIALEVHFWD